MDSVQLRYALLNSLKIPIAVCAKDQLKQITYANFAIICNNQFSYEVGQHWLAFYKQNDVVEFFDSFGMPIEFYGPEFKKFVTKHGKNEIQSQSQFQSNASNLCGGYCLYFLIKRANQNLSYNQIISGFSLTNQKLNDSIIRKFVQRNFIFPKFSKCGVDCLANCSKHINSYCLQKNKHCNRVFNNLLEA